MNEPVWLLDAAVLIAHEISLANFGGAEGIRDTNLLASVMARPKNLFAYEKPDLYELAAAYTSGIVKNHPFVDGNKRTGFLAGASFLELNGVTLTASEPEATRIILGVASGVVIEAQLADWYRDNA
ncbi:type II toxin-antitoxin system death-on-curing family toxin [Pseudomonadota bacterium]